MASPLFFLHEKVKGITAAHIAKIITFFNDIVPPYESL